MANNLWHACNGLLKRTLAVPTLDFVRGVGQWHPHISLKRFMRRHPSKFYVKPLKNKRVAPGFGMYAGQISNFDTNELQYFNIPVPEIPLTPTGTDYKPSKLLAVWRLFALNGQPYWIKEIMEKHLELTKEVPRLHPVIVKNTPSINQMLWHVKHLTRIRPITFPDGFPAEEDLGSTFLNYYGELKIRKQYKYTEEQLITKDAISKMDQATLTKHLRLRWTNPWHL